MSLKTIAVYTDGGENDASRVDIAIKLAKAHEAHLTGIHVMYVPMPIMPDPYSVNAYAELLTAQRDEAKACAENIKSAFKVATDTASVEADWQCLEGDFISGPDASARCADLAVIGRTDTELLSRKANILNLLIFELGRPVMLVPQEFDAVEVPGKRVLLAWSDSREAAKITSEALPIMQQAEQVDMVMIEVNGEENNSALKNAAAWLGRHGVNVNTHRLSGKDSEVGEILLQQAATHNSDLLVMGAYGHSRLREIVLGGATRHILSHTSMPILMMH
ncbi:MAG: universal stress protein [Pseudomonadota bacterium]